LLRIDQRYAASGEQGQSMETPAATQVYLFFWHALTWTITIAAFPIVTGPWGPYAYKVWFGNKEIDEDLREEMWIRSIWCSGALFVAALLFAALDYFTYDLIDIKKAAGPIHIVYLLLFLILVAFAMMHFYALEDFFSGLSLAVIYLYIPVAVCAGVYWLKNWNPLADYVYSWLTKPQ
jgi:hypothetical protein